MTRSAFFTPSASVAAAVDARERRIAFGRLELSLSRPASPSMSRIDAMPRVERPASASTSDHPIARRGRGLRDPPPHRPRADDGDRLDVVHARRQHG